jgi:hypothetical protein
MQVLETGAQYLGTLAALHRCLLPLFLYTVAGTYTVVQEKVKLPLKGVKPVLCEFF